MSKIIKNMRPSDGSFIYTRTSTFVEDPDMAGSLCEQECECTHHAYGVGYWFPVTISDEGCTGSSLSRPGLLELFKQIQNKKVKAVFVSSIDRLTRNSTDLEKLAHLFNANAINVYSVTENVDFTTAAGIRSIARLIKE